MRIYVTKEVTSNEKKKIKVYLLLYISLINISLLHLQCSLNYLLRIHCRTLTISFSVLECLKRFKAH